jgi:hypothetical protein
MTVSLIACYDLWYPVSLAQRLVAPSVGNFVCDDFKFGQIGRAKDRR